jgi:Tol biopolymer transport system component
VIPGTAGARNPSWSPDSRRLVYDVAGTIAVVDVQSGARRILTSPRGREDSDPAWAPDGRTIAFVRSYDIWTMSEAGKKQHLFVENGTEPAWRPR